MNTHTQTWLTERENHDNPLTQRELEVLQEFKLGKSIKEVSESLNISTNTVCSHCKNLYKKLGVNSRQKAIIVSRKFLKPEFQYS